jgi:hypothetical protein
MLVSIDCYGKTLTLSSRLANGKGEMGGNICFAVFELAFAEQKA